MRPVGVAVLSFLMFAVVAYAGVVGAMYVFQRALMYHPGGDLPPISESGMDGMRAVSLRTDDGLDLVSWFLPPADERAPVVVYFQGNAGTIAGRVFKADRFHSVGCGVLLVSYRGFGGNPGSPTEDGLFADARAALAFVEAAGIGRERVVLYGESLGTGVAVYTARHAADSGMPVGAVILEAPFSSIAEVAAAHYPLVPARWLTRDRYDSESRIAGIRAPLMIVHAEDDRVVPIRFGRKLFAAAVEPKAALWLHEGGHDGHYEMGAFDAMRAFLAENGLIPRMEAPK